jgi:hypothetical protein
MRWLGLLALIPGCFSGASEVCPAAEHANGAACDQSLACEYPQPSGRTTFCVCTSGHLWCSDCSATEYGFGACTAGMGCEYSSWETDCSCRCTVRGTWDCTSLDAVSPCPRDPDPPLTFDATLVP